MTTYDQGQGGELPPKVPGRHRWIALAAYVLTEEQAHTSLTGEGTVYLDHENRMSLNIGCWDCEEMYETCYEKECPGDDREWSD